MSKRRVEPIIYVYGAAIIFDLVCLCYFSPLGLFLTIFISILVLINRIYSRIRNKLFPVKKIHPSTRAAMERKAAKALAIKKAQKAARKRAFYLSFVSILRRYCRI